MLVVARYHEIALKRGARSRFAAQLIDNIRRVTPDCAVGRIADQHGRIVITLRDESTWPTVRQRLARVFGIANFSAARSLPIPPGEERELAPLGRAILEEIRGRRFDSFRILTKRADKRFPIESPDVNAAIGAVVKQATGARVDLDGGELTVTIEILPREFLYSVEKLPGPGGLPVGASGRVVVLLSGGIDSPVAAARMMRRGCRVTFVHFHRAPYLDRSSQEKARELVRRLAPYQGETRLVLVPLGDAQREVVTRVAPAPRVILYRRMMVRIAAEIADRFGAEALVTGDSLGQVASQTMRNLAVVEQASRLPIFRPLIGLDKLEVMREAEALGTFDVSIEPDQDCCSLFVPRHPTTRARISAIEAAESLLDVPALMASALARSTIERHKFPAPSPEPVVEQLQI